MLLATVLVTTVLVTTILLILTGKLWTAELFFYLPLLLFNVLDLTQLLFEVFPLQTLLQDLVLQCSLLKLQLKLLSLQLRSGLLGLLQQSILKTL